MTVRIWDVESGEECIVLQGHADTVSVLTIKHTVACENC